MTIDESEKLRNQIRDDRKLIERAAQALAEIDRGPGLADHQADVLAALRIRLEGKERAKLEDLMTATGDIGGRKDLGEVLSSPGDKTDWPNEVAETKREWPGT